jgi:MFS family permease
VRRRPFRQWQVLRRYPDFRRLFIGNSVSLLGSTVTGVALPLTAVVYLHASPVQMGFLGAAVFLPYLALGLPAGAWVDRMPYRQVLVLADLGQALVLGAIPVLAVLGLLRVWNLYVVVVLAGAGNLFQTVTAQSFTPALVPRRQLLTANSALMASSATVSTAGPALGGLLVSLLTAPVAIAVDAVSFVLAALCKARIRVPGLSVVPAGAGTGTRTDIVAGLRAVFGHRIIRAVTLAATVGALAGQMQNVVVVLFLVRGLGLSPVMLGLVIGVGGVAGIAGAAATIPVTERIGPGRAFITGMFLASVAGIVLAAAAGPPLLVLAVLVVAQALRGGGPSLYSVHQQTFRQALIEPALLSRATGTWRFLVYGTQAIGALLGGLLGSVAGLRATLIISSGAMLAGTAIGFFSPVRSLRELPGQEAGTESLAA